MKKCILMAFPNSQKNNPQTPLASRNYAELKKAAQTQLNNLQSADIPAKLAKINRYCAKNYVSLTATLERVKSELKAIIANKTAQRTSPAKKATVATAAELLETIAECYAEAVELQRQAELDTVQSGELCKFSFAKKSGTIEMRISTTAKVAKDQYRKDTAQKYQGGIPSAENTNYIEFELAENSYKCNGFKQFINNNFIGLCELTAKEKADIMLKFPAYFATPKTYREPQADKAAPTNALQIEFPAKSEN